MIPLRTRHLEVGGAIYQQSIWIGFVFKGEISRDLCLKHHGKHVLQHILQAAAILSLGDSQINKVPSNILILAIIGSSLVLKPT